MIEECCPECGCAVFYDGYCTCCGLEHNCARTSFATTPSYSTLAHSHPMIPNIPRVYYGIIEDICSAAKEFEAIKPKVIKVINSIIRSRLFTQGRTPELTVLAAIVIACNIRASSFEDTLQFALDDLAPWIKARALTKKITIRRIRSTVVDFRSVLVKKQADFRQIHNRFTYRDKETLRILKFHKHTSLPRRLRA